MNQLPPEIWAQIFDFLPVEDIKMCREVCRDWCWVASPALGNRSQLEIDSSDEGALEIYGRLPSFPMAQTKSFRHIHFSRISISFSSDDIASKWAWGPAFTSITSLTLYQCDLSPPDFVRILSHLVQPGSNYSNLKHLALVSACDLLAGASLLSKPEDQLVATKALQNVTKLDLRRNELSDATFSRLTNCCPMLKSLDISDTRIQHQPGVYKKYYASPSEENLTSPEVFTYKAVIKFLTARSAKIKELFLEDTCLSESVLQEIACVPGLRLRVLNISRNPAVKHGTLLDLTRIQTELTSLDVSSCNRAFMDCPPETMAAVFKNMAGLKKLKLYGLSIPRGFDHCVSHLNELTDLNIKCLDTPSRALADGLCSSNDQANSSSSTKSCATSLKRVVMSGFASIPLQLGRILSVTRNLQQLDLRASASALTDSVMRVICCYLTQLTHLNVKGCHQLTSYGFLGPNHSTVDPSRPPVENDFSDYVDTGQTIAGLKYLVNLNISGLKIGDEVFEHLQFDDLRALNVSDNYSITSKGFKAMVDKNPTVVWFVASKCSQLEDTSVIYMLNNWKRLVRLEINKCCCLNGDFVEHIGSSGKYLTYLSATKLGVRKSEDITYRRGGNIWRQQSENLLRNAHVEHQRRSVGIENLPRDNDDV